MRFLREKEKEEEEEGWKLILIISSCQASGIGHFRGLPMPHPFFLRLWS